MRFLCMTVMQCFQSWRVRVCLGQIIEIEVGLLEAVLVPYTQILPGKLGPQHYNIIFTPKQSLDVVGLKELEIILRSELDHNLCSLSHQPPLLIYP